MPAVKPAFLRLESLYKQVGKYEVLHDVNFEMSKGEVVAIIRPQRLGQEHLVALHQSA